MSRSLNRFLSIPGQTCRVTTNSFLHRLSACEQGDVTCYGLRVTRQPEKGSDKVTSDEVI